MLYIIDLMCNNLKIDVLPINHNYNSTKSVCFVDIFPLSAYDDNLTTCSIKSQLNYTICKRVNNELHWLQQQNSLALGTLRNHFLYINITLKV